MRIYNRKLKALLFVLGIAAVFASFFVLLHIADLKPLPDDGSLTLIDGKNVIIKEDGYQLDLAPFDRVGETQEGVFVFKNENAASAHTSVNITWNDKCFDVRYEPNFSIDSNHEFEYRVFITLTDYPSDNEDLNFSIRFQTEYYG